MPRRPPKRWFETTRARISDMYPHRTAKDITRITAGIWHKYRPATKRKLTKRYEDNPMPRKKYVYARKNGLKYRGRLYGKATYRKVGKKRKVAKRRRRARQLSILMFNGRR
jgi:hypothetical protein